MQCPPPGGARQKSGGGHRKKFFPPEFVPPTFNLLPAPLHELARILRGGVHAVHGNFSRVCAVVCAPI